MKHLCDCRDDRDTSPICHCDYSQASLWRKLRRWWRERREVKRLANDVRRLTELNKEHDNG